MDRVTEHALSWTVGTLIVVFVGFLVLGTVFYDAAWVGHLYVVAWALLPFFAVAMWFVAYFEKSVFVTTEESDSSPDPLVVLRERYARGEIDEAEFERKTERLLETEHTTDHDPPNATVGVDEKSITRR